LAAVGGMSSLAELWFRLPAQRVQRYAIKLQRRDGRSAPISTDAAVKASTKFAGQKLSAAQSERPISISILDERYDDVRAFEIARILEHLTQQLVELRLLFFGSISGPDLNQDHLVGSRNSKTGIEGDHPAGAIFRYKLIAVAIGHIKRSDDRGVSRIEELLDLGVCSAFENIESKQRHLVFPCSDFPKRG
jgi:hypothetical protein